MSSITLFRHGQAGRRDAYDTLSELGQRQAYLLGEHLASTKVAYGAFLCGGLRRQRETAAQIHAANPSLPGPSVDPLWNEFDLDAVYQEIAPQMAEEDATFRASYEELLREAADASSVIHRRWTSTDIAVVQAWIAGRYPTKTESWTQFRERIRRALLTAVEAGEGRPVAVATSATPIGIVMGIAMGLDDRNIMKSAGALYNSSMTTFRLRGDELFLSSFNAIPHLQDPDLRTFR